LKSVYSIYYKRAFVLSKSSVLIKNPYYCRVTVESTTVRQKWTQFLKLGVSIYYRRAFVLAKCKISVKTPYYCRLTV